ncbi:MAG: hypothetical protein QM689_11510 [Oscillospiraceae bacterium]
MRKRMLPAVLMLALLVSCKPALSEEHSPVVTDYTISSYNAGAEDKQYVLLELKFDRVVKVSDDRDDLESVKLTISGNRVKPEQITCKQEDDTTVGLTVQVNSVSTGKLELTAADESIPLVTDESGDYAAKAFTAACIIPSGVTIRSTPADGGTQAVVLSKWNIRSIAWVKLTDHGTAPQSDANGGEVLDGACAVHGHDFLSEDTAGTAQIIADTLNNYYGSLYRFTCENDGIRIESLADPSDSEIALSVYLYKKLDGELIG